MNYAKEIEVLLSKERNLKNKLIEEQSKKPRNENEIFKLTAYIYRVNQSLEYFLRNSNHPSNLED